jgi:hypothetical protein
MLKAVAARRLRLVLRYRAKLDAAGWIVNMQQALACMRQ